MDKAKRARTAETPKQPSPGLKLRAPYLYPDKSGICEGLGVKFPGPTRHVQAVEHVCVGGGFRRKQP
jgi:hypothetical protein